METAIATIILIVVIAVAFWKVGLVDYNPRPSGRQMVKFMSKPLWIRMLANSGALRRVK